MRRKLLILAMLVGVCALSFDRPAMAVVTCSVGACNGVKPRVLCQCPTGTPASGMLTPCYSWVGDCYEM
jgi:hypothetical protein